MWVCLCVCEWFCLLGLGFCGLVDCVLTGIFACLWGWYNIVSGEFLYLSVAIGLGLGLRGLFWVLGFGVLGCMHWCTALGCWFGARLCALWVYDLVVMDCGGWFG